MSGTVLLLRGGVLLACSDGLRESFQHRPGILLANGQVDNSACVYPTVPADSRLLAVMIQLSFTGDAFWCNMEQEEDSFLLSQSYDIEAEFHIQYVQLTKYLAPNSMQPDGCNIFQIH